MKKKFTYSFVACFAVMAIILCGGCFGGKLAWADATYTKVGGISAKVVDGSRVHQYPLCRLREGFRRQP